MQAFIGIFLFTFWEWERARVGIKPTAAAPSQPDCPGVSHSDHSASSKESASWRALGLLSDLGVGRREKEGKETSGRGSQDELVQDKEENSSATLPPPPPPTPLKPQMKVDFVWMWIPHMGNARTTRHEHSFWARASRIRYGHIQTKLTFICGFSLNPPPPPPHTHTHTQNSELVLSWWCTWHRHVVLSRG